MTTMKYQMVLFIVFFSFRCDNLCIFSLFLFIIFDNMANLSASTILQEEEKVLLTITGKLNDQLNRLKVNL